MTRRGACTAKTGTRGRCATGAATATRGPKRRQDPVGVGGRTRRRSEWMFVDDYDRAPKSSNPDVVFRTEGPCLSLVCGLVLDRVPFALTFSEDGKYQIEDLTPVPEVGKYTDRFRQEKKMLA